MWGSWNVFERLKYVRFKSCVQRVVVILLEREVIFFVYDLCLCSIYPCMLLKLKDIWNRHNEGCFFCYPRHIEISILITKGLIRSLHFLNFQVFGLWLFKVVRVIHCFLHLKRLCNYIWRTNVKQTNDREKMVEKLLTTAS